MPGKAKTTFRVTDQDRIFHDVLSREIRPSNVNGRVTSLGTAGIRWRGKVREGV
jgi:hypothetical protein